MTTESIKAIGDRFSAKVAAAGSHLEEVEHLYGYLREVAEDRARTVYLALEAEAERSIQTEHHEALRSRLSAAMAVAGCELAKTIGDTLEANDGPIARGPAEHAAAVAYQAEFDRLLNTVGGGGLC